MNWTGLAAALCGVWKLFSLWFALTGALFWKRPAPYPRKPPQTRFACLIAARNEERVIGALVESLRAQHYPDALYDIYVIPNNCTDATESAALAAGAKLVHCSAPVRRKGDALRQAIAAIRWPDYDAFCVFDADNLVHPDYLSRMNDAICSGARVAKARLCAKNPSVTWVTGCYAIYYGLNELFFNRSRASLGLSAKLVGTGFAVRKDVLQRTGGWNTETIAEDAEFSAACALIGERIFWVPEAITYDEAPREFRISFIQRRRWCSGIMDTARRSLPELIRSLRSRANARTIDMIAFLCLPFAQALSPFLMAVAMIPRLLFDAPAVFYAMLSGLGTGFLATVCIAAAACKYSALRFRTMWKSILLFPVFMASWLPLQVISLFFRQRDWREIRHWGDALAGKENEKTAV